MKNIVVFTAALAVSSSAMANYAYQGSGQNAGKNSAAIAFDRAVEDCKGANLPWNQNSVAYVQVKCERTRTLFETKPVSKTLYIDVPAETESLKVSAKTDKYSVQGLDLAEYEINKFETTGLQRCSEITEIKEEFKTGYMTVSCSEIVNYASLEDVCSDAKEDSLVSKKYAEAKKLNDTSVLKRTVVDSWESCGYAGSAQQNKAQQQF